jgi:hypothetical protein
MAPPTKTLVPTPSTVRGFTKSAWQSEGTEVVHTAAPFILNRRSMALPVERSIVTIAWDPASVDG